MAYMFVQVSTRYIGMYTKRNKRKRIRKIMTTTSKFKAKEENRQVNNNNNNNTI